MDSAEELREERRKFEERRLSEYSLHQRRAMLLVAAASLALSWGGIRPSELNAFGITIAAWEESFLLGFLCTVLLYLMGTFAIVAKPEFVTWSDEIDKYEQHAARVNAAARELIKQGVEGLRSIGGEQDERLSKLLEGAGKVEAWIVSDDPTRRQRRYIQMYRARIRWEFWVPLSIAGAVLVLAVL